MEVIVGVDGSAESREALRWALEEARLRGATVRAVYAWRDPYVRMSLSRWIFEAALH